MKRFEKALEAYRTLCSLGDYDWGLAGALGEIFAEERFKMRKAPRGETGIDGYIGNRSVSVKAKEPGWREASAYVGVSLNKTELADDLLIVLLDKSDKVEALGPFAFSELNEPGVYSDNNYQRRYYLKRIRNALANGSLKATIKNTTDCASEHSRN